LSQTDGVTLWRVFLRQISSPFDALLMGVAALALLLRQPTDAAIVLVVVAASVLLGTHNEYRAERTIEALRNRISRCANVQRDGEILRIDVSDQVLGDLVLLRIGDIVPADLRITKSTGLECDESVLTGESRPVEKREGDAAYMGTAIAAGTGTGSVVKLGAATRYGEIASHAAGPQPRTTFEKGLARFSAMLVYITAVVSSSVFLVSLLIHRPFTESLLFALAISVSLTPQLLPVIVSVSLAVGGRRLAREGAIVKKLVSIENLGNLDVLLTDKTGTLTTGNLTFDAALDDAGRPSQEIQLDSLLCNERTSALDKALWEGAPPALQQSAEQLLPAGSVPFDYERRVMSVVAACDGEPPMLIVKGAPEAVLARCDDVDANAVQRLNDYVASGARVLAVAVRPFNEPRAPVKSDEAHLRYAGALLFRDPDKPGVAAALSDLRSLGVRVKVITGDHEGAARILCERVGLAIRESMNGEDLDRLSDAQIRERLPQVDLFARISPVQKERIVRLERSLGDTVAFLGDGVNDVLALRAGDAGISVDSAADIAKEAADIVLMSKDLAILAAGVREGRRIFANTIKYILMATSSNFGNMISAGVGSMLLPFLPLLPSQVLLNNMLYDASEMTIPSDNVDKEVLVRPEHWDLPFVRRFMAAFGPYSALSDFAVFAFLMYGVHATPALFRSGFFIESFLTQALMVFFLRTRRVPFFRSRPSPQLACTTLLCAAIGVALPFTPLSHILGFVAVPLNVLTTIGGIVLLYVLAVEVTKSYFFHGSGGEGAAVPIRHALEND
jgi:Mg2+-importing ATPase